MRPAITWYDLLDTAADAPPDDIEHAYAAKAGLLRPGLLSGAPPKVATAAMRARGIIDAARQVLADPVSRRGYDEAADLWRGGWGLSEPGGSRVEPGLPVFEFADGNPGADVLSGLTELNVWLADHPRQARKIPVPDVRGLFYDVFQQVVGKLDINVTFVQLTQRPMPVDGLVVDQSPEPSAMIHRREELTVQVWHPVR
jgi:hypothetical protein